MSALKVDNVAVLALDHGGHASDELLRCATGESPTLGVGVIGGLRRLLRV